MVMSSWIGAKQDVHDPKGPSGTSQAQTHTNFTYNTVTVWQSNHNPSLPTRGTETLQNLLIAKWWRGGKIKPTEKQKQWKRTVTVTYRAEHKTEQLSMSREAAVFNLLGVYTTLTES